MARSRRAAIAVAAALALPLAVACNALVGIDEYTRVVCTGGKCDGGTIDAVAPDATPDAPTVLPEASVADASGTKPVSWAQFHMPNYDAGGTTDNPMSYKLADSGVYDDITKLTWEEPLSQQGAVTYAAAQATCASLTRGGKWRLPTRIELVTLLDLTKTPSIPAEFKTTQPIVYWTSSEVRPFGGAGGQKHWTVGFNGTEVLGNADENGGQAGVRCIREL